MDRNDMRRFDRDNSIVHDFVDLVISDEAFDRDIVISIPQQIRILKRTDMRSNNYEVEKKVAEHINSITIQFREPDDAVAFKMKYL